MKLLLKLIKIGWYLFCGVFTIFIGAFFVDSIFDKTSDNGSGAMMILALILFVFCSMLLLKFALKIRSDRKVPVRA